MPTLPQQLQANYVAANFNHHLQQIKNKFKNFPPLQVLHRTNLVAISERMQLRAPPAGSRIATGMRQYWPHPFP